MGGGETLEQHTIYAKQYVELANTRYAMTIRDQHRKNIEARQEAQRRAIQAAEQRKEMLDRIAKLGL
jgi:hypothetical protein